MALTDERKAELMAYCKLDELAPGEDILLENFFLGAISTLAGAGVRQPPAGTPRAAQYALLVDAIVLDNWDNRGTRTKIQMPENRSFRLSLNQMKQTEPVFKLDTGTGV